MKSFTLPAFAPKHFTPDEFDHPEKVSIELIGHLDLLREALGSPIVVTSDYREGAKAPSGEPSFHALGWALDIASPGISCVSLFLEAEKLCTSSGGICFGGIGLYPDWSRPGIHIDLGPKGRRWCQYAGTYRPLTRYTLRRVMEIERGRGLDLA